MGSLIFKEISVSGQNSLTGWQSAKESRLVEFSLFYVLQTLKRQFMIFLQGYISYIDDICFHKWRIRSVKISFSLEEINNVQ